MYEGILRPGYENARFSEIEIAPLGKGVVLSSRLPELLDKFRSEFYGISGDLPHGEDDGDIFSIDRGEDLEGRPPIPFFAWI